MSAAIIPFPNKQKGRAAVESVSARERQQFADDLAALARELLSRDAEEGGKMTPKQAARMAREAVEQDVPPRHIPFLHWAVARLSRPLHLDG